MIDKQLPFQTPPDQMSTNESGPEPTPAVTPKSSFVEPEISAPVDVLEATTFFQAATSGGTN